MRKLSQWLAAVSVVAGLTASNTAAWAWGDVGHEVVARIADHYLTAAVRKKVQTLLATDTSKLTADTSIASEATWADKYRDSDRGTTNVHYLRTRSWHFVDVEIDKPDIDGVCFGHPPVPAGKVAADGPARDCVVDQINEFAGELKDPHTSAAERLIALQFLLHFVGDLHQPLHASDNHDRGGNAKNVSAAGTRNGSLHHYWDTEFVRYLGSDSSHIAANLIAKIKPSQRTAWSAGSPTDWANESFSVARSDVHGKLPKPGADAVYRLPADYVKNANAVAAMQLSRAGVRLARVLNGAMK